MSRKKETVYAVCPLPLGDTARFFWVLLEQDPDEYGALWPVELPAFLGC